MERKIRLQFSSEEFQLLATMAANELFRIRYINPRFSGHTVDIEVFRAAQSATTLLTEAVKRQKGFSVKPSGSNN